ncbi:adenosine deaminase family protein [bacterium]|nr:adenosine deaminase family protein [bacterium]
MILQLTPEIRSLIRKLPKSDLHCHLDGSIRLETLIELAGDAKVTLPSTSVEGLNELVFKTEYRNLEEYLKTFEYSTAVMQTPESLQRIAFELIEDAQGEGVRYMEIRFAPQLHVNHRMDMQTVLKSVYRGAEEAKQKFNQRKAVREGEEPPFHYGIIVCALRSFGPFSEYYRDFINSFRFTDMKTVFGLCSLELARGAVKIRDDSGIPVTGFDLAGAEAGNPARDHREAFQYAHAHFLMKTVHAGEAYGAQSIFQAITELHANRIGHGYYLFDPDKIDDTHIPDKLSYIDALVQYIADRRITIEVCLTSNLQTNPAIASLKNHTLQHMMKQGLSCTICTDNRTVSKTTVSKEIALVLENFQLKPEQFKNIVMAGIKRSFFPGPYMEKRQYVRSCIDYYEKLTFGTALETRISGI